MVRVAGSFHGVALVFKEVLDRYHWRHVVVVADEDSLSLCWYVAIITIIIIIILVDILE